MKKITVILIVIALLCRVGAMAQQYDIKGDKKTMKQMIEKSTTIIEGKVVDGKRIYKSIHGTNDSTEIYALILVKPIAVLKGSTDSSKVYEYLVLRGNYFGSPGERIIAGLNDPTNDPQNGIFFLSDSIPSPDYNHPFPNAVHVDYNYGLGYNNTNRERTLKDLEENYGLKPIAVFDSPIVKKKSLNDSKVRPRTKPEKILKHTSVTNKKSFNNSLSNYIVLDRKKSIATNDTEFISFELQDLTCTTFNPSYFEFDININADLDSNSFFDHYIFTLQYNTLAFGHNIVSGHNISITKGISYLDSTYYNPMLYAYDYDTNIIAFPFGVDTTRLLFNRTRVVTNTVTIFHVKMLIQDCSQDVASGWGPIISQCWFTRNSGDAPNLDSLYQNIGFSDTLIGKYCMNDSFPYITHFTDTVYPGSHFPMEPVNLAKMVIYGHNFLDSIGQLYFHISDDGGQTLEPLNNYDINLWTNDSIIVTLPSVIDSFPNLVNATFHCVGSGSFLVVTAGGDTARSSTAAFQDSSVFCPYAIISAIWPASWPLYRKVKYDLVNVFDTIGYTFRFDSSIHNFALPLKPFIKRAMKDWVCATGVNFVAGTDTMLDHYNDTDKVCNIFLVNTLPDSALMSTQVTPFKCNDQFGNVIFIVKDIDIGILRNPTMITSGKVWWVDTLQNDLKLDSLDFFESILHEFGHASCLKHVNQKELMYLAAQHGPIPGGQRRLIDIYDMNGGLNVNFTSSLATTVLPSCQVYHPMIMINNNCVWFGDVNELNHNVLSLKVYPNPVHNTLLNIAYDLKEDAPVNFILLNSVGKEIYSMNANRSSGKNVDQINMDDLATGIYYLEVIINKIGDTMTLVKIK